MKNGTATAESLNARIINTSSGGGLQGSVGQGNYSAAKAGIAALTLVAAAEMGRYGVTVNAIAPSARTRMTETVFAEMANREWLRCDGSENISPLVVWLGSVESADVTGRVFEVEGGIIRAAGAGSMEPRSTRVRAGNPANSVRWCAACSPRPPPGPGLRCLNRPVAPGSSSGPVGPYRRIASSVKLSSQSPPSAKLLSHPIPGRVPGDTPGRPAAWLQVAR